MPPWLPEQQETKFADELRLSDAEINRIVTWVEQGTVEGDAADLPPAPKFVEGWRLGEPDLVLKAEKPFILPPQGTDTYRNFIFRVPIQQTKWVKAVEISAGRQALRTSCQYTGRSSSDFTQARERTRCGFWGDGDPD